MARWRSILVSTAVSPLRARNCWCDNCSRSGHSIHLELVFVATCLSCMRPEKVTRNEWREAKKKVLSGDCWVKLKFESLSLLRSGNAGQVETVVDRLLVAL